MVSGCFTRIVSSFLSLHQFLLLFKFLLAVSVYMAIYVPFLTVVYCSFYENSVKSGISYGKGEGHVVHAGVNCVCNVCASAHSCWCVVNGSFARESFHFTRITMFTKNCLHVSINSFLSLH